MSIHRLTLVFAVAGTWRVGGVLAVSRAFGDRLLKKYVVAEPEIQVERKVSRLPPHYGCLFCCRTSGSNGFGNSSMQLHLHLFFFMQEKLVTKEVEFLLLASDGLWDVVSNQVCFLALLLVVLIRE